MNFRTINADIGCTSRLRSLLGSRLPEDAILKRPKLRFLIRELAP